MEGGPSAPPSFPYNCSRLRAVDILGGGAQAAAAICSFPQLIAGALHCLLLRSQRPPPCANGCTELPSCKKVQAHRQPAQSNQPHAHPHVCMAARHALPLATCWFVAARMLWRCNDQVPTRSMASCTFICDPLSPPPRSDNLMTPCTHSRTQRFCAAVCTVVACCTCLCYMSSSTLTNTSGRQSCNSLLHIDLLSAYDSCAYLHSKPRKHDHL